MTVTLASLLLVALPVRTAIARAEPRTEATLEPLKLLISIEQQTITAPFPARITLHLHNSGPNALWLYRRARDAATLSQNELRRARFSEGTTSYTTGGSTLTVRLEPAEASQVAQAAQGTVFESVGLPHPRLVKLNSQEDYEEKTVVQLAPTLADSKGESKPIWGHYRLSLTYGAKFSNAEEIARNLALEVWHGEATSNAIEIELLPPPAAAHGSAAGTVISPNERPVQDAVISLSDEQEHVVGQLVTGPEGRFAFTQLPLGLYWVTARLADSQTDTAVFRHVELTADQPAGAIDLLMSPQEAYEPKNVLHKPVLFRITDGAGRPLDKVALEMTWSNGTVMDNVKGETSDDGTVAVQLIPGRNFVTLKRRGCPKQEQRADVGEGDGIDDFELVFECAKK